MVIQSAFLTVMLIIFFVSMSIAALLLAFSMAYDQYKGYKEEKEMNENKENIAKW